MRKFTLKNDGTWLEQIHTKSTGVNITSVFYTIRIDNFKHLYFFKYKYSRGSKSRFFNRKMFKSPLSI